MRSVPRQRLLFFAVATAIAAVAVTAAMNRDALIPSASLSTVHTVEIETIDIGDRFVWGITIADFDGDGDQDFLVAGHSGRDHDRIYYYDGSHYQPSFGNRYSVRSMLWRTSFCRVLRSAASWPN